MRIAMIGATGLIGRALAPRLAATHDLLLIGRRAAGVPGAQERIAPMPEWPAMLADAQVDVAISTLGTTIKQAGSWEAFRAVDVDAVVSFARAARGAGARQFITVSTAMAMPGARNRYLALKGEAERVLGDIGFDRVDIVRPFLQRLCSCNSCCAHFVHHPFRNFALAGIAWITATPALSSTTPSSIGSPTLEGPMNMVTAESLVSKARQ